MELMYPDGFDDHSPFRFIKWEDREWAINILTEAFVELDQKGNAGDDMYNKLDYLITDVYGAKFHTGCKVAFNYSGEIRLGTLVDIKKTNKLIGQHVHSQI